MILVTGAGGFLGSALIARLCQDGTRVRVLVRDRGHLDRLPSNADKVVADIRERAKVQAATAGCDTIIHLAGKAHALDEDGNNADYHAVNVEGTRNLLEAAMLSGVDRFIFISSVKVFGEETRGYVDETSPANPQTSYGRSKWQAECLVHEYAGKSGMTAVALRLPMVYGPTLKGNLYRMIAAIDRGWFPPLPQLSTRRSMLHVENFISAVRACLACPQFIRPAYIVSDARPYTTTEIYEGLCRGLGKPVPSWRVPLGVLRALAMGGDVVRALSGRSIPFTSDTLNKLIGEACYSPHALMQETAYRPVVCFEDAVSELIEHYRRSYARC